MQPTFVVRCLAASCSEREACYCPSRLGSDKLARLEREGGINDSSELLAMIVMLLPPLPLRPHITEVTVLTVSARPIHKTTNASNAKRLSYSDNTGSATAAATTTTATTKPGIATVVTSTTKNNNVKYGNIRQCSSCNNKI